MNILSSAGTPAVVAYSLNRALSGSYTGSLFQVARASDNAIHDIGQSGGVVDHANYDLFCGGTTCYMTKLYDQGPSKLDFTNQAGYGIGSAALIVKHVLTSGTTVFEAQKEPIGGVITNGPARPGVGYVEGTRGGGPNNGGMPGTPVTGAAVPTTQYVVVNGHLVIAACCFEFGNAESTFIDRGYGHEFSNGQWNGTTIGTSAVGPYLALDLEDGGRGYNLAGFDFTIETGVAKTDGTTAFSGKSGNSQSGGLTTFFTNFPFASQYQPLHLEGGISFMTGGDGSNGATGGFYEGYITAAQTSDAADDAVQANIVSFYGPQ